ncbi:hypothetical protein JXB12_04585 [candidate division KSB1 bacterium]|nr:hypothetical protein [candidate division KSB1 bacterium]
MKKLFVSIGLLMLLMASHVYSAINDVEFEKPCTHHFITGLAFDGQHLWYADRQTDTLYQVDTVSDIIHRKIPSPGYSPTGLTWDGTHLWCIDDKEGYLYRIDISTGVADRVVESYTKNPKDLAWDGTNLWVVDDRLDLIMSLDPEDGMMITHIPTPSMNADGLTFDGKYLWVTDRIDDMIYRVDPVTGMVVMHLSAPHHHARGLAWDGKAIWNADYESDRLYRINIDAADYMVQSDGKELNLDNYFEFRNYGPDQVIALDVYIAVPTDRDNQRLIAPPRFEPAPVDFVTDEWGQRFAHYRIAELNSGEVFRAKMIIAAEVMAVRYHVDPDKVGSLKEIPGDIKEKYLVDGKKILINDPYIKKLSKEIVGNETNPYWIARKIYQYLIDHLSYNLKPVGGWNTAPTVLKRGTASCSEYSFSLISLCRANGVPARYVGAVSLRGDDASMDDVFHRWCEVYLPNYGWIPFDANKGDHTLPGRQATGIGDIAARYIITTTSGGSSGFMDWTYNYNFHWKSQGKCRIYADYYSEWSPLHTGK